MRRQDYTSAVKTSSVIETLHFRNTSFVILVRSPSTSVLTAIRASSCTPPDPAVLWNILNREAMTTSEICKASWCCTFRRTFCEMNKSSGSADSKPSRQNTIFQSIKFLRSFFFFVRSNTLFILKSFDSANCLQQNIHFNIPSISQFRTNTRRRKSSPLQFICIWQIHQWPP